MRLLSAALIGSLVLGGAPPLAAESTTVVIPYDARAHRTADLFPAMADFNRATLSGVWLGHPPEAAMAPTLAILKLTERVFSGEVVADGIYLAALDAAIAAGSQDPMVLYLDARFHPLMPLERLAKLRKAYAAFTGSPYPAIRKAICQHHIILTIMQNRPVDIATLAQERIRGEADLMEGLASLPRDDAGAEVAIASLATEILDENLLNLANMPATVLKDLAAKRIPTWWSEYLQGTVQVNLAWAARGNGWANGVTPQGWQDMATHLALARTHLVAAWRQHPERPEPAAEMITVAMGGDTEAGDELTWFERSLSGRFDYDDAYTNLSYAWTPRWGGSYEQMLLIGTVAADTKRFDTPVPGQLIKRVRDIWSDAHSLGAPRPEILDQAVYDRCKVVSDTYLAQRPGGEVTFASSLAVLAWMCGLPAETLRQLDKAGPTPDLSLFTILEMRPNELRALASAPAPAPEQAPPHIKPGASEPPAM